MTATDELRRLLDERGVEWGNIRNDGSESDYLTEWQFEGIQSYAVATEWAVGGGLSLETHRHHLTPAQAIAATLGSVSEKVSEKVSERTCRAEETECIDTRCYGDPHGGEVYHMHVMECSACGGTYEHVNGSYEFCPRCGAKVVDK